MKFLLGRLIDSHNLIRAQARIDEVNKSQEAQKSNESLGDGADQSLLSENLEIYDFYLSVKSVLKILR